MLKKRSWTLLLSVLLLVSLLALPGMAAAQPPVPDTVRGIQPSMPAVPPAAPRAGPLNGTGLVYKTSLDLGDPGFSVYDPATDTWAQLAPYETSAQMAVSASGQLYAYGYNTGTIDLYDPATDTWSAVLPAPPGTTGTYGNLEITDAGEFLYTETWTATLWYTVVGGVWTSMALPFMTDIMGDYDPTADQYVIGEAYTTKAHWIDVHTWAITDYNSPLGNGEYSRFGVVTGNRYYFEAGGSPINYFDLANPAAPPIDTGVVTAWYGSACADRGNALIYNASLDGTQLWAYDPAANVATPLTGGDFGWHSSLACVTPSAPDHFSHINKMKMNGAAAARPGYYKVVASARIHDEAHDNLAGATVLGDMTLPNGTVYHMTYVTDSLGRAKFPVKEPQAGTYSFCITDIQLAGYVYDPAANEMGPCMSVTVP